LLFTFSKKRKNGNKRLNKKGERKNRKGIIEDKNVERGEG